MEEYGSDGMDELIRMEAQPGKFLADVDFFCISVCFLRLYVRFDTRDRHSNLIHHIQFLLHIYSLG